MIKSSLFDNLNDRTKIKGIWLAEVACLSSLKMKFNWDKYKTHTSTNKQANKKLTQVKDRWLWITAGVHYCVTNALSLM